MVAQADLALEKAPDPPPLTIWAMTTGEAGMRAQALGLAHAIGGAVSERTIGLRKPWSFFPGDRTPAPLLGLDPAQFRPGPPWPDILVTCGRRSTAVSVAIRRLSGGRCFTIHVQNPKIDPSAFDLVVPMAHDEVDGPNVYSVDTALNAITPERLSAAARAWEPRFAGIGRPLIGVLLGGSTRRRPFSLAQSQLLLTQVERLAARLGAGLAVTASRRTPPDVRALFAARIGASARGWMWDTTGPNPYLGILASADRIVVTSDSVSMVSEALTTGRPVDVFDLNAGRRHARFLQCLVDQDLVRRLGEAEEASTRWPRPTNATAAAAAAVRAALTQLGRFALSGETGSQIAQP